MSAQRSPVDFDPAHVWHGDTLGVADMRTVPSGYPALDAQLPGGGWPAGSLIELLHAPAHDHAWQVVAPALATQVAARSQPALLVGAPHQPFGPGLAARGLPPEALVWVRSDAMAARLWACEQALRCRDVAAVVAWLPQARVGDLRRLQLAAAQHDALLFVCRPASQLQVASPARLRILVEPCADDASQLALHIAKRRGPPLVQPVALPSRHDGLAAVLAASRQRRAARNRAVPPLQDQPVPALVRIATVRLPLALVSPSPLQDFPNALDRTRLAAA